MTYKNYFMLLILLPASFMAYQKSIKISWVNFFQFRPIWSAYNAQSLKLSKYLAKKLAHNRTNEYTINKSDSFSDTISKFPNADCCHMVSNDADNLFTNLPLSECFSINLEFLPAVVNDGALYKQVQGLRMGLLLNPTFSIIWTCFRETLFVVRMAFNFQACLR